MRLQNKRMKQSIADEVMKQPLVGKPEPVDVLDNEYKNNDRFLKKIAVRLAFFATPCKLNPCVCRTRRRSMASCDACVAMETASTARFAANSLTVS